MKKYRVVEMVTADAANNEQRIKRKAFYIQNGYTASGVSYIWRQESYEILVNGGELSEKEFEGFWENAAGMK